MTCSPPSARATGASTEALFFGAYLVSLALIWAGVVLIGTRLYPSPWLTVALAAVITLRHSIPRTSANSLEPYFHPRLMAFGIGMIAIAAFLRRRDWLAVALVGLSAVCHVTTALWFAILIGTALAIVDRHWRRAAVAGAGIAVVVLDGRSPQDRFTRRLRRWTPSGSRHSRRGISSSPTSGRSGSGRRTSAYWRSSGGRT